jgi:tRNA A-37 threonylcarbamoyl transferase component Bud32
MTAPFPPECAARYRPARLLAQGGFASVWLADQLDLERPVVVKLLHPDLLTSADQVERFLTEAKVTAALSHPNIVILIDHGMEAGVPWIVFEYLPRGSLATLLQRGALPWRDALAITAQVASALQEAHAHGILHRDVKPANLLEAEPGIWKVADFGVAKWAAASTVSTQDGLVVGSPAYLSPEQLVGAPATPRSDVYALGLVTFQSIVGDLPRAVTGAGTPSQRAVRKLGDVLPQAVLDLLDRALELDPEKRYASAGELRAAAVDALSRRSSQSRRRPRRGTWAVAAAVACALGGLALVARRGGEGAAWTELPRETPAASGPALEPPPETGIALSVGGARELLDRASTREERAAQADRLLRHALDAYHARPVPERAALWAWTAGRPGLAEAIRLHVALAPPPRRDPKAGPRHDRLSSFLRSVEKAERENPLYWACRGLAAGQGTPPKDPGGIDPVALQGGHDGYTGLFLALTEKTSPATLAEVTLMLVESADGWRPTSAVHRGEWTAWRLMHVHDALERAAEVPPELRARLEERHHGLEAEARAAAPRVPESAPPGAEQRIMFLYERERVPESRTAYLLHVAAAQHGGAPPTRELDERFLELLLVRLIATETVGGFGEFGVAYDFAASVENSLKGTAAIEESALSLQRATLCARLERSPGGEVKARLYRATLVSRCLHPWLLARHHEAAEAALERWPGVLDAARLKAAKEELARIRARRR